MAKQSVGLQAAAIFIKLFWPSSALRVAMKNPGRFARGSEFYQLLRALPQAIAQKNR
jgi:hypothetical protein